MQEVTMTVQVPVELQEAFMERVREDKKSASRIVLELMRSYAERTPYIDEQERAGRKENTEQAFASVQLEGYKVPEIGHILAQLYIDGKITMQERIALGRMYCGLKASQDDANE